METVFSPVVGRPGLRQVRARERRLLRTRCDEVRILQMRGILVYLYKGHVPRLCAVFVAV
jgi:hypothetical protein